MSIAEPLLQWYHEHGRNLPWRGTRDPYRILVSEIMLQQTQVSRVLEYFDRFLEEFPDWHALASATNAEVIHAWAGLGYNRRALMLRDMAKHVVKHGVPESREAWQKLKGIGPYTSAALAVFSLHENVLPIDTNIRRVLGRMLLGKAYPQPKDDEDIERAAERALMQHETFYDVPQALFDLATMHCGKMPDCSQCPMKDTCLASKAFIEGEVVPPKRMIKKAKERIHRNKKHPDRIYRGRILTLVRENGPITPVSKLGPLIDNSFDPQLDMDWLVAMVKRLHDDELLRLTNDTVSLE